MRPDNRGDPAMPASLAAITNEKGRTYVSTVLLEAEWVALGTNEGQPRGMEADSEHWYRTTETWWRAASGIGVQIVKAPNDD